MVQYDVSRRRVPQKNDGSKASALFTFGSPSIVPFVAGPSLAMGLWATGVTCAWNWSPAGEWLKNLPQSQILITLLGVVMGLLLVFRTNTAYDRYYEGRKVWANTHSNIRSLARLFWAGVKAKDDQQEARKRGAMTLLAAFAVATKHHVRDEAGHMWDDLGPLLAHIPVFAEAANAANAASSTPDGKKSPSPIDSSPSPTSMVESLTGMNTAALPIEIVFRLQKYVRECKDTDQIDANIQLVLAGNLNALSDSISVFERIRGTPIPIAYELHLKQTLIIYLLSLPFQIVTILKWYTIPATIVASFTMYGIEAIGGEIQNPFGYDPNDLPQDEFCDAIRDEVFCMMGDVDAERK
ncbi:hypothetical protein HDU79_001692 [Rhizoclosmatium sp. JEL0117]|nr:hypothetical protein HDU79_001692 [Rhizoclosmatium sp. JEL0117]